jgi:hypothetical protein
MTEIVNTIRAKDWEWMQHCVEIAEDFQSGPGSHFYRPGFESARLAKQNREWN